MVTAEFVDKLKEISEKTGALKALIPDCVNIQRIFSQYMKLYNVVEIILKNIP
jgi:hypothetical protein